jgi:hypothetical protein
MNYIVVVWDEIERSSEIKEPNYTNTARPWHRPTLRASGYPGGPTSSNTHTATYYAWSNAYSVLSVLHGTRTFPYNAGSLVRDITQRIAKARDITTGTPMNTQTITVLRKISKVRKARRPQCQKYLSGFLRSASLHSPFSKARFARVQSAEKAPEGQVKPARSKFGFTSDLPSRELYCCAEQLSATGLLPVRWQ